MSGKWKKRGCSLLLMISLTAGSAVQAAPVLYQENEILQTAEQGNTDNGQTLISAPSGLLMEAQTGTVIF